MMNTGKKAKSQHADGERKLPTAPSQAAPFLRLTVN